MEQITISKGENFDITCSRLKSQFVHSYPYDNNLTNVIIKDNGDASIISMAEVFSDSINLISVDLSDVNTSICTNLSNLFYNCTNLTNVVNFNTNNVTTMQGMFENCYNLTTIPNLNVSKVRSMTNLFTNCNNLTTIPNFNVRAGTQGHNLFRGCSNLTTAPNINYSNFSSWTGMFAYTNITSTPNIIFRNADYYRIYEAFSGCNLETISGLWYDNSYFDNSLFNSLNLSSITNVKFLNCDNINGILNVANIYNYETSEEEQTLNNLYGADISFENINYVSNIMHNMSNNMTTVNLSFDNVKKIENFSSWDSGNLILSSLTISINNGLTNASGLFKNMTIYDYDSSSYDPSYAQPRANKVTLSGSFNFSKVTDMSDFASNSVSIVDMPSVLDTSNVTNMANAFYNYVGNLPTFTNTAKVTNMSHMFYNYSNNKEPYTPYDPSSYDEGFGMEIGEESNGIILPIFDTSNVTNFDSVFYQVNLGEFPSWNFAKAEDISYLCYEMNYIPDILTINVKRMEHTFHSLGINSFSSENALNFAYWNTSNAEDLTGLFYYCSANDIPTMNISNAICIKEMFSGMRNLVNVENFANYNISKVNDINGLFQRMRKITKYT